MKFIPLYLSLYNPVRLCRVFYFLLTIFLLLRRKRSLLGLTPLSPQKLFQTIQRLGPSFIKLSQVLATRADFFEAPYLEQLRNLHDQVPQMKAGEFQKVFSRAFGDREVFAFFDRQAFASASIGQVHAATLAESGEKVAVKQYTKNSIEAVLEAFARMILREVDLAAERTNLEKFSQVYAESGIRFPRAYARFSSRDALVMSFEEGVRFDDREALKALEVSFDQLMEKLVLFYTEQMLVKGYFHADPHPGNLLVNDQGELVLLDFGMVTRIPNQTRLATISLVKAAYERDYEMMIYSARKLGIITGQADAGELEELAERVFDIFSDQALEATSMQELVYELMLSLRHLPFKVPQETIYLMRVSAIIEGLGTIYIENFNGIKDILPILKANLPRALGEYARLPEQFAGEFKQIPFTILKVRKIIDELHEGELTVHLDQEDRNLLLQEITKFARKALLSLLLIVGAFYVREVPFEGNQVVSWILFALGSIRLLFLL